MSYCSQSGAATAFAQLRPLSLRAFLDSAVARIRIALERRKQHRELLDYMASDYRAAADMGITGYEARNWYEPPFRRA
jgi:hypothetical protein